MTGWVYDFKLYEVLTFEIHGLLSQRYSVWVVSLVKSPQVSENEMCVSAIWNYNLSGVFQSFTQCIIESDPACLDLE